MTVTVRGMSYGPRHNQHGDRLGHCTRVLQHMSTESVSKFIDRHLLLLSQERDAEVEKTSLVSSNCGPKLLEQKGLALNGLGITSIGVGLGNKTCVRM